MIIVVNSKDELLNLLILEFSKEVLIGEAAPNSYEYNGMRYWLCDQCGSGTVAFAEIGKASCRMHISDLAEAINEN